MGSYRPDRQTSTPHFPGSPSDHEGDRQSQTYPGCHACTWGRRAGSWPLEHGRDSSQGAEDSWVPDGGGECQDRRTGDPGVVKERCKILVLHSAEEEEEEEWGS